MKDKLTKWIEQQEKLLNEVENKLPNVEIASTKRRIEAVGKLFMVKQKEDMLKGSRAILENLKTFVKEEL